MSANPFRADAAQAAMFEASQSEPSHALNDVQAVLLAARTLIADPKDWTQGSYARSPSGRVCLPRDEVACQWCAVGALAFVTVDHDGAYECMERAVGERAVSGFNDSSTHAEVIAKFDEAIVLAGEP